VNEDHKAQTKKRRGKYYDDEIELMEYIQVVWKWKYLILAGSVICTVITLVISLNAPKLPEVYRINMTVQPPNINNKNDLVKKNYIVTVDDIVTQINIGVYNKEVARQLEEHGGKYRQSSFKFKASIPRRTNFIEIYHETSNVQEGINILNYLSEVMTTAYAKEVQYFQNIDDIEKHRLKKQIAEIAGKEILEKANIAHLQERIVELKSEINHLNKNTELFLKKNGGVLKNKNENSEFLTDSYAQSIQQNINLKNMYKSEINEYLRLVEKSKFMLNKSKGDKEIASMELNKFAGEINRVNNIKVLRPPFATKLTTKKTNTKLNVIVAAVAGLFLMVLIAFFLEYLSRYKKRGAR